MKVKFATTCINGTAGLDIAFQSIDLSRKDNIIMPVVNFIASYSMANKIGANIYLADVDSFTGQMTPKTLIECIKKNNIKNALTKSNNPTITKLRLLAAQQQLIRIDNEEEFSEADWKSSLSSYKKQIKLIISKLLGYIDFTYDLFNLYSNR